MFWTQLLCAQPLHVPKRNSQGYCAVAAPHRQSERSNDSEPQSQASDVLGSNEARATANPPRRESRDTNINISPSAAPREYPEADQVPPRQENGTMKNAKASFGKNTIKCKPNPKRRDLAVVKPQLLCGAGRRAGNPAAT